LLLHPENLSSNKIEQTVDLLLRGLEGAYNINSATPSKEEAEKLAVAAMESAGAWVPPLLALLRDQIHGLGDFAQRARRVAKLLNLVKHICAI
jgi:hypothetical protein